MFLRQGPVKCGICPLPLSAINTPNPESTFCKAPKHSVQKELRIGWVVQAGRRRFFFSTYVDILQHHTWDFSAREWRCRERHQSV